MEQIGKPINPCPNCGSNSWQKHPELTGLLVGNIEKDGSRAINMTKFALVRIYCCQICGYLEFFSESSRIT